MTVIVVEDDKILRFLEVILDARASPARRAAFRDYLSFDEPDPEGWFESQRARAAAILPATVIMARDRKALSAALPEADAAVVESLTIGADDVAKAPGLRLVQKFGTDIRNVDVAACRKAGVAVRTLRRRVNAAVAEHALMLMMAVGRKLVETEGALDLASLEALGYAPRPFDAEHVAGANWARIPGLRGLLGATLGALGLGEVGREVALRARACGMKILYHQRSRLPASVEKRHDARYAGFHELLERSDFLSVHLPLTDATRGMIDAAAFARMKPGTILVNVSRARIVDRSALVAALDGGRLGGAAFDVHYEEPGAPDETLKAYRNVVLSPHVAVAGRQYNMADIAQLTAGVADALTRRSARRDRHGAATA